MDSIFPKRYTIKNTLYFSILPKEIIAQFYDNYVGGKWSQGALNIMWRDLWPNIVNRKNYDEGEGLCQYMEYAATHNYVNMLIYGINHGYPTSSLSSFVAYSGSISTMQIILNKGVELDDDAMVGAAYNGHTPLIQWLRKEYGLEYTPAITKFVVINGHLDTLQWIIEDGCCWDNHVALYAAKNGRFEILRWIYEHYNHIWRSDLCIHAVESGNLSLMKWLKDHECFVNEDVFKAAIYGAKEEIIQWLVSIDCHAVHSTMSAAAEMGNLPVMRILRGKGVGWDYRTYQSAIHSGCTEILDYMYENNCLLFDVDPHPDMGLFCAIAAGKGNIKMIEWFRKRNCAWDEHATSSAIMKGHIDTVKWLYEHGCPFHNNAKVYAATLLQKDILQWLREKKLGTIERLDD